jgi:hypothetical protein
MSQIFLDVLTFSVAAGAALIYIHTLEAEEDKRRRKKPNARKVKTGCSIPWKGNFP